MCVGAARIRTQCLLVVLFLSSIPSQRAFYGCRAHERNGLAFSSSQTQRHARSLRQAARCRRRRRHLTPPKVLSLPRGLEAVFSVPFALLTSTQRTESSACPWHCSIPLLVRTAIPSLRDHHPRQQNIHPQLSGKPVGGDQQCAGQNYAAFAADPGRERRSGMFT